MIKTVLIDLDDVLNCFTMYALRRLVGPHINHMSYDQYPKECGWNITAAFNKLAGTAYTPKVFWAMLPKDVWYNVPPGVDFRAILDWAKNYVGWENTFIVTSPTLCPHSASGKMQWIQRDLPPVLHRNFAITSQKHLLANANTLLLDDNEENVKRFNAHGGHGVLMPRPWNSATELRLP